MKKRKNTEFVWENLKKGPWPKYENTRRKKYPFINLLGKVKDHKYRAVWGHYVQQFRFEVTEELSYTNPRNGIKATLKPGSFTLAVGKSPKHTNDASMVVVGLGTVGEYPHWECLGWYTGGVETHFETSNYMEAAAYGVSTMLQQATNLDRQSGGVYDGIHSYDATAHISRFGITLERTTKSAEELYDAAIRRANQATS